MDSQKLQRAFESSKNEAHLYAGGEENVVLRDDAGAAAEEVYVVAADRLTVDQDRALVWVVQPLQPGGGVESVRHDRNGLPLHAAR